MVELRWPVAETPIVPPVVRIRCDAMGCEARKRRRPGAKGAHEETAARASADRCCPAWFEGVSDCADAGLIECAEDGSCDAGEQVCVFVGVERV